MGTALIGLIGTVVGAVSDKTSKDAEAQLDAWMDSNKDLIQSNMLPVAVMGTVFVGGLFAIIAIRRGEKNA
jgi:hypothetical protein